MERLKKTSQHAIKTNMALCDYSISEPVDSLGVSFFQSNVDSEILVGKYSYMTNERVYHSINVLNMLDRLLRTSVNTCANTHRSATLQKL